MKIFQEAFPMDLVQKSTSLPLRFFLSLNLSQRRAILASTICLTPLIWAVLTDEGTTLKRFMKRENGRPWLLAENKSYPKEKRELKPSKIEIQGIALKVIKDIK